MSEVANKVVETMLENEQSLDPKYFSSRVPTLMDEVIEDAKAAFMEVVNSGRVENARRADEVAQEIAQDALDHFDLDPSDDELFDEVVTPLHKLAAELFPGNW